MNVVVESIETHIQLEKLQKSACEFGQIYLISPPVSSAVNFRNFAPKIVS
jgi:EAL domain-containing protein (putative c-di-GMP-specific phosphodiesterase class I)